MTSSKQATLPSPSSTELNASTHLLTRYAVVSASGSRDRHERKTMDAYSLLTVIIRRKQFSVICNRFSSPSPLSSVISSNSAAVLSAATLNGVMTMWVPQQKSATRENVSAVMFNGGQSDNSEISVIWNSRFKYEHLDVRASQDQK